MTLDLDLPAVALAIAAHPDDAEFGCGATLAKWAARGTLIHLLVITDGSRGTWDSTGDPTALVAVRADEQRAAATALGATGEVVLLGAPDGELDAGLTWRAHIVEWIRALRPEVVLGHDPWRRYRVHPDHRHAGWLTVDAVASARDPLAFRTPDPAHHVRTLLLFEADEINHHEDVTGFEDAKLAALSAHRSQERSTMFIDPDDDGTQRAAFAARVRERLSRVGREAGVGAAEAFQRIDLDDPDLPFG